MEPHLLDMVSAKSRDVTTPCGVRQHDGAFQTRLSRKNPVLQGMVNTTEIGKLQQIWRLVD